MQPSIFRPMVDSGDRDETMILKRANPIYDSDDDEDLNSTPLKRKKTLEGTTALQWEDRLKGTSESLSSIYCLRE